MTEDLIKLLPYLKDFGSTIMLIGAGMWAAKVWFPTWSLAQAAERARISDAFNRQQTAFLEHLAQERAINQAVNNRLMDMLEKGSKP